MMLLACNPLSLSLPTLCHVSKTTALLPRGANVGQWGPGGASQGGAGSCTLLRSLLLAQQDCGSGLALLVQQQAAASEPCCSGCWCQGGQATALLPNVAGTWPPRSCCAGHSQRHSIDQSSYHGALFSCCLPPLLLLASCTRQAAGPWQGRPPLWLSVIY